MSVEVTIVDGPLVDIRAWDHEVMSSGVAGAHVVFEGRVRREESARAITGLDYEVYEPMAVRELRRLGEELLRRHGLLALRVLHSRGRVGIDAVSFRLEILSGHRKEALKAMDEFIDRMKRDVPIWKRAVEATAASTGSVVPGRTPEQT